jgi:hypothetical protein
VPATDVIAQANSRALVFKCCDLAVTGRSVIGNQLRVTAGRNQKATRSRRIYLLILIFTCALIPAVFAAQTFYLTFQIYIYSAEAAGNTGRSGLFVTLAEEPKSAPTPGIFDPNTNDGFVDVFANYLGAKPTGSAPTPTPTPSAWLAASRNGVVAVPYPASKLEDRWHNVTLQLSLDDSGLLSGLTMKADGVSSAPLALTTPLRIKWLFVGNYLVPPSIQQYGHVIANLRIGSTEYGNDVFDSSTIADTDLTPTPTGSPSDPISQSGGSVTVNYTSNADAYAKKAITFPTPAPTP